MTATINQAIAQANRFTRAMNILKEGYTFHKDADREVIAVCKPGEEKATYWINMLTPGCDCPDSMKNGNRCKHELAWSILEDEREMHGSTVCRIRSARSNGVLKTKESLRKRVETLLSPSPTETGNCRSLSASQFPFYPEHRRRGTHHENTY